MCILLGGEARAFSPGVFLWRSSTLLPPGRHCYRTVPVPRKWAVWRASNLLTPVFFAYFSVTIRVLISTCDLFRALTTHTCTIIRPLLPLSCLQCLLSVSYPNTSALVHLPNPRHALRYIMPACLTSQLTPLFSYA